MAKKRTLAQILAAAREHTALRSRADMLEKHAKQRRSKDEMAWEREELEKLIENEDRRAEVIKRVWQMPRTKRLEAKKEQAFKLRQYAELDALRRPSDATRAALAKAERRVDVYIKAFHKHFDHELAKAGLT